MKPMKRFLAFTLSLSMLMSGAAALAETDTEACTIPTDGCDQGVAAETATKRDAWGKNGAVVAGKAEAAEVGVEVLKAGGNAVDAAVATGLAIGFFEPNSNGLGGGGFMNIWLADQQKNVAISSQFPAPMNVTEDYFQELYDADGTINKEKRTAFNNSGKSTSIMKALATYQVALDNFGTMTLAEIIPYVTKACENGIRVTATMKSMIENSYEKLSLCEDSRRIWFKDGILPYEEGDVIYNQDYIDTLNNVAEHGIEWFYKGEMAEKIVNAIQSTGGVMCMEDLEKAMTDVLVIEDTVMIEYRGYKLYSMPLPSSGGVIVGEILNIMENKDIAAMGHNTPETIHFIAEAMKLAYADRTAFLGDPTFTENMPIEGLSSKEYAKAQLARIGETANTSPAPGDPYDYENESQNTTHYSVIDKDGNMACMTQSINAHFGCGITVGGFVLSNGLMSFDTAKGHPNSIAPGKLSLSSMTPTILLKPDGTAMMVSGSPGGAQIIAAMVNMISNIVDHNMNLADAVYAPRFFANDTGKTYLEGRFPQETIDALKAMGHDVQVQAEYNPNMGSANTIVVLEDGSYHAVGDPRRDSQAAAY